MRGYADHGLYPRTWLRAQPSVEAWPPTCQPALGLAGWGGRPTLEKYQHRFVSSCLFLSPSFASGRASTSSWGPPPRGLEVGRLPFSPA